MTSTEQNLVMEQEQAPLFIVADPGFPQGRGPNPPGVTKIRFCQSFPKLHEIERIWTGGSGRPKFYYVDPPLIHNFKSKW